MAVTTLKKLFQEHVKRPAPANQLDGAGMALRAAYDAFMEMFGDALDDVKVPLPDPAAAAKAVVGAVGDALSPMDPSKVLLEVARAVSEAERTLNGQNLAVLQGKVNVQLLVKVGDLAGAQANFDLAIGPTPQG